MIWLWHESIFRMKWNVLLCFVPTLGPNHLGSRSSVQPADGAPRITVNGRPVCALVCFGADLVRAFAGFPPSALVTFDFTAPISTSTGTMHFRCGNKPGEVYLDDLEVRDLDSSAMLIRRNDFQTGSADLRAMALLAGGPTKRGRPKYSGAVAVAPGIGREGSAGLKITLTAPPDGIWPDFHIYHIPKLIFVEGHRYRTSFWVRASTTRDLFVSFYQPGQPFLYLGGPSTPFEHQVHLAAEAGIDFVSYPIPLPWPEPGQAPDWSGVDAICRTVLRSNPKALLLPRIGLYPPAWWCKAHPDEVMRWEDGPHENYAVPASPLYRRDAAAQLTALIGHLEQRFGDDIAGYHPTGQNTGEWFYMDTWKRPLSGDAGRSRGMATLAPGEGSEEWKASSGHQSACRPGAQRRGASCFTKRRFPQSNDRGRARRLGRFPAADDGRMRDRVRPYRPTGEWRA